jgi:Cft2 family RNA processing exonuclease
MLILTKHAREKAALDNIDVAWIEATIASPQHTDRDPRDATLTRAWRRVPEPGGRPLRVVYYLVEADIVVVTALFDRGAKRWLPT